MDSVEFFNRTTAALFRVLLEQFPRPIHIFDVDKFRGEAGLPRLTTEGNSEDISSIVEWLAAEGFIRYRDQASSGDAFTAVVLTSKGLTALSRVPDALTPKVTVADRLKELSREASKEVITTLVKIAITGAP